MEEPKVSKRDHEITVNGDTRVDPWFWLREQEDPETIPYLEAENAYTKGVMKDTEGLQEALYREMRARIKEDDESVPVKEGDYYYTRFETGGQYRIHCRKHGSLKGKEEVILNVNALAEGLDYMRVCVPKQSRPPLAGVFDRCRWAGGIYALYEGFGDGRSAGGGDSEDVLFAGLGKR